MATILNLTTGIVFVKSFSGTFTGTTLAVDTIKLDSTNQDVILVRDGANILAIKNGTNAQDLRVYGSTTNSSYSSLKGTANLTTTSTDGLVLRNETPSTAGVPVQQSPRIRLRSHVWNTTAVAADNTDDWTIESVPVSGATPSSLLKFGSSLNGAATTFRQYIDSQGDYFSASATGVTATFTSSWSASVGGMGTTSNHPFIIGTNSSERIRVLSTGQVGILTNAPASALTINGDLAFTTSSTGAGTIAISATAPTIASGFGTGASVPNSNGTAAFTINVGSTTATTGVITLPAAAHGWALNCTNLSTQSATVAYTKQTATSATSATIGCFTDIAGAHAWADNDIISITAMAY